MAINTTLNRLLHGVHSSTQPMAKMGTLIPAAIDDVSHHVAARDSAPPRLP